MILAIAATTALPSEVKGEDIHDIQGPISIPYPWLWVVYLLLGLLLMALIYWGWKQWGKRKAVPVKDPYEIAVKRLEAARLLMVPERTREFSFELSELTRAYIEERFHQRAVQSTTEEFLYGLLNQMGTPLSSHRLLLEDFLQYCDMAKFAGWQLSASEMSSMYESALTFLRATKPNPT